MSERWLATAILLAILLGGCGVVPHASEDARIANTVEMFESAPAESFHGTLLSERTRSFATFEEFLDEAQDARVVYVGETHTNPVHHGFQELVVRRMWEEDPRLAIGLEMFFRPFQPALEAYLAGEIDEVELLRRSEYFDRWSFDWEFYAPVIRFAREKGLPVVALNIPREITRKVSRGGGLDALTDEERAALPEIDTTDEEHRAFVQEVFSGGHMMGPEMFEGFYTAMCIWDEGMADSAVKFLESPPGQDRRMVVLVGAGHVRRRFGIPKRVERRTGWRQIVLVPLELRPGESGRDWTEIVGSDEGDYLYVTPPPPFLMPARLGIGAETENPPEDGVAITRVIENGPAAAAGVLVGDVLLRLGRQRLTDLVSLKLALNAVPRDRSVRLVLRRGEKTVTTAVLIPSRPPAHPRP